MKMKRQGMRCGLAVCLVVLNLCVYAAPKRDGWQTYHSPEYGFAIDYPVRTTFYSGRPIRPPQISMFPICEDTTVACFHYTGKAFTGRVPEAIGVSVNVLRDIRSQSGCNRIDGSSAARTTTIHGTLFHYDDITEGGMGSGRTVTAYRAFYQKVCFEVAIVVAGTYIAPEDLEEAGFRAIDPKAERRAFEDTDRMLHSFRFVGLVKDGPNWSVYSDTGCGQSFEYPFGATVQKVVEFSKHAFDSPGIACEQAFTWRDRTYTLAVKAGLKGPDGVDEWLLSSPVSQGNDFSERSDQTSTYIFHGSSVYIFTVSDENRKVISPAGDRIFAHLLSSFNVR
jgi:hypothetical protein